VDDRGAYSAFSILGRFDFFGGGGASSEDEDEDGDEDDDG
jgi:hypothetical protein